MISYLIQERVNPNSPTDPRKYYATSKATGKINLRTLAKRISRESTLSIMDTQAVLEGFIQVIPDLLLEGNIVALGEFGTFRLTLSSEGAETPDEFNVSMIKKANLLFRAGSEFKDQLSNVKFTRVSNGSGTT